MLNPSRYRIIAIGKVRKEWIKTGLHVYQKRLSNLSITELRDSNPIKEAEAIQGAIKQKELVIALCEEGEILTSLEFYHRLKNFGSKRLVFVIGGANGLSSTIKKLAHCRLSLSPLTFPHEIARLLLAEQIFRAITIAQGGPYHRS